MMSSLDYEGTFLSSFPFASWNMHACRICAAVITISSIVSARIEAQRCQSVLTHAERGKAHRGEGSDDHSLINYTARTHKLSSSSSSRKRVLVVRSV